MCIILIMVESDDDDEDEELDEEEVSKTTKKANRSAASGFVFTVVPLFAPRSNGLSYSTSKSAPARKPTQTSTKAKQTTLNFAPSGTTAGRTSTRAAAGRARGKMAKVVSRDDFITRNSSLIHHR